MDFKTNMVYSWMISGSSISVKPPRGVVLVLKDGALFFSHHWVGSKRIANSSSTSFRLRLASFVSSAPWLAGWAMHHLYPLMIINWVIFLARNFHSVRGFSSHGQKSPVWGPGIWPFCPAEVLLQTHSQQLIQCLMPSVLSADMWCDIIMVNTSWVKWGLMVAWYCMRMHVYSQLGSSPP